MKQRFEMLDLWRSLCVLLMVLYHFCWDLEQFGYISNELLANEWAVDYRLVVGGSFVVFSGMTSRFSKKSVRRGFRLFCLGFLVSIIGAFMHYPIQFGILQLLGIGFILNGMLEKKQLKWRRVSFILLLAAFILTALLTKKIRVESNWLYPFGFIRKDFFSVDYWPIFPWLFLFFLGVGIGDFCVKKQDAPFFQIHLPSLFSTISKYSLMIYLLHQPILYGSIWIWRKFIS